MTRAGRPNDMTLSRDSFGSVDATVRHEWLVTNGIGGYASSTVSLLNTRRYHGLLVAALNPPVGRAVIVAKLDVALGTTGIDVPLATNEYADGTIDPRGYRHLESFPWTS